MCTLSRGALVVLLMLTLGSPTPQLLDRTLWHSMLVLPTMPPRLTMLTRPIAEHGPSVEEWKQKPGMSRPVYSRYSTVLIEVASPGLLTWLPPRNGH